MSNTDPIRWQQRLQQFSKAARLLLDATSHAMDTLNELEREGVIQRFEYTFELAWKTLKDVLFYEGFDVKSPREVLRQAFDAGHLSEADTEALLDALSKRNLLTHTYNEETAREAFLLIKDKYAPVLERLLTNLHDYQRRTQ